MSTPQPTSGPAPGEKDRSKRRSLTNFVKNIIRTTKSGKKSEAPVAESSTSAAAPGVVSSPIVEASSSSSKPVPEPTRAEPPTVVEEEKKKEKEVVEPIQAPGIPTQLTPAQRARLLAEKHGIEISEEWPFPTRPPPGERVEKPIRMRVRRYCHVCQTAFGSEKTCPSCNHKRCADCPRSPAKSEKQKAKKYKEYDIYDGLTRPNKSGGQDLIHRDIRQRVHYKCHKCQTDFSGAKACSNCNHRLCKLCPREPPRKVKPVTERPKRPLKWTCSECQTPSNTSKKCTSCQHTRCVDCVKEIPKKKKKKAPVAEPTSDTDVPLESQAEPSTIENITSTLAATTLTSGS